MILVISMAHSQNLPVHIHASIPQVESRIERLKDLLDAEKENLEALEAKKEEVLSN